MIRNIGFEVLFKRRQYRSGEQALYAAAV